MEDVIVFWSKFAAVIVDDICPYMCQQYLEIKFWKRL